MRKWALAVSVCLILSPLTAHGAPQSAYPSRYETEQAYTEAPDAKLASPYPELQTEKVAPGKQPVKVYKPRGRFQQHVNPVQQQPQQPQQEQPQQDPNQELYQQYQVDRTSAQAQPTPSPASQYEQQQNQYDSRYLSQAKYSQQTAAHHEHRPVTTTTYIPIIRLEKTQSLDGAYQQSWETGNNIIATENGYLKHISEDQDALVQTGNYTYTAPDGSLVWTSYIADEGGFKVSGSHIPTPPPIPEEIQRGLQQIYEGIRLQQEAAAREAKSGKKKPISDEENSVVPENYTPQSDNYPPQYRYYQQQQQQKQQQQYRQSTQQQQQPSPQQYPGPQQQSQQYQEQKQQYRQSAQHQPQQEPAQQYQEQPQQNHEQPQTFRPIVAAQPYRKVQKVQRPPSQQFQESQRIQQNQPEQYDQPQ